MARASSSSNDRTDGVIDALKRPHKERWPGQMHLLLAAAVQRGVLNRKKSDTKNTHREGNREREGDINMMTTADNEETKEATKAQQDCRFKIPC